MRPTEKPVTEPVDRGTGRDTEQRETHPAYAIIGAHRIQGDIDLFGSDLRHHGYIAVTIRAASLTRSLSHDWIHGHGRDLIQVCLSEAQWATFISTLNMGDGGPCTLERFDGKAVPGIERHRDRREQFKAEMAERVARAVRSIEKAIVAVMAGKTKKSVGAKTAEELTELLGAARQDISSNVNFVAESFDGHIERATESAKVEVHAYATGVVHRAGLTALRDYQPPELPAGEGKGDE